jgi:hypothetical protein
MILPKFLKILMATLCQLGLLQKYLWEGMGEEMNILLPVAALTRENHWV